MTNKPKPVITLPPAEQIGFVVKDVDKAVAYYSATFGWGPFQIMKIDLKGFTYQGKKANARLKLAFAKSGTVEIERRLRSGIMTGGSSWKTPTRGIHGWPVIRRLNKWKNN